MAAIGIAVRSSWIASFAQGKERRGQHPNESGDGTHCAQRSKNGWILARIKNYRVLGTEACAESRCLLPKRYVKRHHNV
jgi:hypothetical protein